MKNDLFYQLALSFLPQIGPVQARLLTDKFGDAETIFRTGRSHLEHTEGIGTIRADSIHRFNDFDRVEKELAFIEKYKIRPLFITHPSYPKRLLECYDPPTMLYFKGNADLNSSRVIALIGSRTCSAYGKSITEEFVTDLAPFGPLIVSGLAFGIDACAHRSALKQRLPTVGVMAHGFHTLYPPEHHTLAREMLEQGGLLTEFPGKSKPDRHNFPIRNRVVAGMADATIVVESGLKGGSLITATLANGYNREVFAFPGKITDPLSAGCNRLIYTNKATLLTSAAQFAEAMGWESAVPANKSPAALQQESLFAGLSPEEQEILTLLQRSGTLHIDEISSQCSFPDTIIAASMLNLELQNQIVSLPGKRFRLAR